MSGHVVLAPILFPAVGMIASGAAIAAVAGRLAGSVRQIVDLQVEAAQKHAAGEKGRLEEWAQMRARQQRRMESFRDIQGAVHETERRLAALGLPGSPMTQQGGADGGPAAPAARAYLTVGKTRIPPEELARMLQQLTETLESLPAAFREAEHSPYARLMEEKERLLARFTSAGKLEREEIEAFNQMLRLTMAGFLREEQTRQEFQEAIDQRLAAAIDGILFHEHLASSPNLPLQEQLAALGTLKEQVTVLLGSHSAKLGPLEILEKRLAELKTDVARCVVESAHRRGLCGSITSILEDMGYGTLEAFSEDSTAAMLSATMRIPGGEQVSIAIHRNNQIGFQVVHERFGEASELESLNDEELAFLHTQETKWCGDFKTLVRRLIEAGFGYEVNFEGAIQDSSVKVVVVESPGEVVARAEEEEYTADTPQKRYLS
jgi:hypothetical protein